MEEYKCYGRGRAAKLHRLNTLRIPKCLIKSSNENVGTGDGEKKISVSDSRERIIADFDQFDDVDDYISKLIQKTAGTCICDRDIVELRCHKCNKPFKGRPNMECHIHRNVIHLMDITHCPSCRVKI